MAGDRVSLIGVREEIENVKKKFRAGSARKQRVLIGGGGETGFQLALLLETRGYSVTVMEVNRTRCDFLSNRLPHSTIIHGDTTNRNDIYNEQIENLDTFVACTGSGESNIISALEVKTHNPKIQTMILSDRPNYRELALRIGIDKAFVPAIVMARQVLGFLNTGAIIFRNTQLFPRAVDVLELNVPDGAAITKDKLRNVKLPPRCLFGAVIRDGSVQVPSADFQFHPGDDVVALVQPDLLNELIKLF
jgi:trk system potassium uptake protein TrkA